MRAKSHCEIDRAKSNIRKLHRTPKHTETGVPASCSSPANDNREEGKANLEACLVIILTEIKDFRQDNKQQLKEIKEEISKTKKKLDEVKERVSNMEERMQSLEEVT